MVKNDKDAKKLAKDRRVARQDKESEIDGMLCDAAYISKVSAIAVSPSAQRSGISPSTGVSPAVSPTTSKQGQSKSNIGMMIIDGDEDSNNINSNTLKKQNTNGKKNGKSGPSPSATPAPSEGLDSLLSTPNSEDAVSSCSPPCAVIGNDEPPNTSATPDGMVYEVASPTSPPCGVIGHDNPLEDAEGDEEDADEDDDFRSCLSTSHDTFDVTSTTSLTSSSAALLSPTTQKLKDFDAFPWYKEAVTALDAVDEEAYEGYVHTMQGCGSDHSTDNPYILPAAAWWAKARIPRLEELNAKLAKEKRLLKTGSHLHQGTTASSKTKANQKIEKFKLPTSNRFGGLRI